jgi:hypothetical protein
MLRNLFKPAPITESEPAPKLGRVEQTLTAKHPLSAKHKGVMLVSLPAEEGRVHAVTGIRAASKQSRQSLLLTVRSGPGPVKAYFYLHTEGPGPFPQAIKGEVGQDLFVGLQWGEKRPEGEDGDDDEEGPGPSVSLVVWTVTDDEEEA